MTKTKIGKAKHSVIFNVSCALDAPALPCFVYTRFAKTLSAVGL